MWNILDFHWGHLFLHQRFCCGNQGVDGFFDPQGAHRGHLLDTNHCHRRAEPWQMVGPLAMMYRFELYHLRAQTSIRPTTRFHLRPGVRKNKILQGVLWIGDTYLFFFELAFVRFPLASSLLFMSSIEFPRIWRNLDDLEFERFASDLQLTKTLRAFMLVSTYISIHFTVCHSIARIVAPIFGGFSSVLFNWRFSFFCLALIWGAFAAYAAIYMVESCPDNGDAEKQGTFRSHLRRILVPGAAKVGEEHVEHLVAMMAWTT